MTVRLLVLWLGLFSASTLAAEQTEVLNLAEPIGDRNGSPGEPIRLLITNKLPQYNYQLKTTVRDIEIPALTWPSGMSRSAGTQCDTLATRFSQTLQALTEEEKVPGEIAIFKQEARDASCPPQVHAELDLAIASTTQAVDRTFTLEQGQELVVEIERAGRNWSNVLSAGARGEWRTFYGFNFLPNEDEGYFASQDQTNPESFVITRKTDREDLDFAPSVIFSWLPAGQRNKTWGHGLAVGLGFDLDNPIVFGGYAATYNQNIALTAGIVFHKQTRLAGRFEEGQVIMENLGEDQLTEETFAPNVYIGIGFRFGSNIFERSGNR